MKKTLVLVCLVLFAFQGFSQKKRRTKKRTTEKKEMVSKEKSSIASEEEISSTPQEVYSMESQEVDVDVIVYADSNEKNVFHLKEIALEIIQESNDANGCINYHLIDDITNSTNSYIIELWESPSPESRYVFNEFRTKTVTNKDNSKSEKRYRACGVALKTEYEIFVRMIESGSTSVLDLAILDLNRIYEIADKNLIEIWDVTNMTEIRAEKLIEHKEELDQMKSDIMENNKSFAAQTMQNMVRNNLIGPARISGIQEKKDNEVKKVSLDKCGEIDISSFGTFYYGVHTRSQIKGENIYQEVGTIFFDNKEQTEYGVKKGKEELLTLIENNAPLFIGDNNKMEKYDITSSKGENTIDLDFRFELNQNHLYSKENFLYFTFLCQAAYLHRNNIRVIAYDSLTSSLNDTMMMSIYNSDKLWPKQDISGKSKSNTHITVNISNAKKSPFAEKNSITDFFTKDDPVSKSDRFAFLTASITVDEKEYSDITQLKGQVNMNNLTMNFNNASVNFKTIDQFILDRGLTILDLHESKKEKLKSLYVKANAPMSKGDKYKVYSVPNFGEKTKVIGKLKIKEVLNRYVGIAEVKDGDKDLMKMWNKGSTMYTDFDSGGLFGKSLYSSSLKILRAKNNRI